MECNDVDDRLTAEEIDAISGLNNSYIEMEKRIYKMAPKCHFTPMILNCGDGEDCVNQWWECGVCGHTKSA